MCITVNFHKVEEIDNVLLKFAVIMARYNNQWIFCRHKERSTYEIPGGHRECGESIDDAAKRELFEETGAVQFDLTPICVYSVLKEGDISYGKLYFANVRELSKLPIDMEIGEIVLFDKLPNKLTYPQIQPHLYNKTQAWRDIIHLLRIGIRERPATQKKEVYSIFPQKIADSKGRALVAVRRQRNPLASPVPHALKSIFEGLETFCDRKSFQGSRA